MAVPGIQPGNHLIGDRCLTLPLEVLDCALVFFSLCAAGKGAQVAPFACAWVPFSRIEAEFA
jgi:hypothetical protein